MIDALADHGVPAQVFDGLTGVWTAGAPPIALGAIGPAGNAGRARGRWPARRGRKIGSIGIHVSRGVTTHGLAVNVNNDLQPFEWIVPCGMEAARMTSLSRELGAEQDLGAFPRRSRQRFAEVCGLGREPRELAADGSRVCSRDPRSSPGSALRAIGVSTQRSCPDGRARAAPSRSPASANGSRPPPSRAHGGGECRSRNCGPANGRCGP